MNQAWRGEPSDLLTAEGCRTTVEAKPLHVVDETFCLIPTDGAKCRYMVRLAFGASTGKCEPTKKKKKKREKGYRGGVPAASPMLKLAKKDGEDQEANWCRQNCVPFPYGVFCLYLNFSLIFGKIILSSRR